MAVPTKQELLDRIAANPGIIRHDLMQIVSKPEERRATEALLNIMDNVDGTIRHEGRDGPERKFWVMA